MVLILCYMASSLWTNDIVLFLGGSVIGCLFEHLVFNRSLCGDTFIRKILHLCLPMSLIYGLGLLIVKYLYMFLSVFLGWSVISTILVITTVIVLFECLIGKISLKFNGYHTWSYDTMTFCDKYASVPVTLFWLLCVTVIVLVLSSHCVLKI